MTNGFRNALLVYALVLCLIRDVYLLVVVIVGIGDECSILVSSLFNVWASQEAYNAQISDSTPGTETLPHCTNANSSTPSKSPTGPEEASSTSALSLAASEPTQKAARHIVLVLGFFQDGTEERLDSGKEMFVCTESALSSKQQNNEEMITNQIRDASCG